MINISWHSWYCNFILYIPPWRWLHTWPKHVGGWPEIKLHKNTLVHFLVLVLHSYLLYRYLYWENILLTPTQNMTGAFRHKASCAMLLTTINITSRVVMLYLCGTAGTKYDLSSALFFYCIGLWTCIVHVYVTLWSLHKCFLYNKWKRILLSHPVKVLNLDQYIFQTICSVGTHKQT
jgi:hypothetical protein